MPLGSSANVPSHAAFEEVLLAARGGVRDHAHVARAAAGGGFVVELVEVLLVGGVRSREAGGADAGAPLQRLGLDARVVGERGLLCGLRRAAGLDQRVLRVRVAGLLGSGGVVGEDVDLDSRQQALELAHLVRVAGREQEPHGAQRSTASCAARRPSMPVCASASNSSRWVRDSGVRSAVACTSTRPPSPVMTTFASTSALESSG